MRLGWLPVCFAMLLIVLGTGFWMGIRKTPPPVAVAAPEPVAIASKPRAATHPEVFVSLPDPDWSETLNEYENWIRQQLEKQQAPGIAVAVVHDTSVLFLKGLGYRNATHRDTVDVHTVFRLGSVSKSITATLAAHLVKQNVLQWDDPVVRYVPGFQLKSVEQTAQTTIRHLLSHTAGLPYHAFTDRVDAGAPIDTLIYHLRDLPLVGAAGEVYSYQNVAFSVFARVAESVFNQPYEKILQQRLFEPLRMADASASREALVQQVNYAVPHTLIARKWMPVRISATYYNVGPAGGMNASISDMARWLSVLTSHKNPFLDTIRKAQLFDPYVRATARNRHFRKWKRPGRSYYGLGWRVLTFPGDTLYYHGGYVNGFRSEVAYHPASQTGIAVLVNAPGALADQAVPEFFYRLEKQKLRLARSKNKTQKEHDGK